MCLRLVRVNERKKFAGNKGGWLVGVKNKKHFSFFKIAFFIKLVCNP